MAMLSGIRIVDLTTVIFGPYATQMLADLGAEVIKVETPGLGDVSRYLGSGVPDPTMGSIHLTVNRGKRSIALDLKQKEDAAVLRELIATADVFFHNVRGKAIARLGFDYDGCRAIRPDIIYVHCTGFGQDGPYADLQAYDDVIQAATGTTSLLPRVDGDPRPRYLPSLIADKTAGQFGAQAILAALVHKLRTGEGQEVEVPMFECFASFMLTEHLRDATLEDSLDTVANATRTFYRVTAPRTVLVIPDTAAKRREYDEEVVRTFYLSNADLKETMELLRMVLDARRISPTTAP